MTLLDALTGFAVVAALITIVPGLDTAIVLRAAVRGSRSSAAATAVGVGAGVLVWGVAAALGVAALLTASRIAYDVVRFAGAAYLVYLGLRLLVSAVRRDAGAPDAIAASGVARPLVAFRTGLLTNLLNPKVGVFYLATLPQFLVPDVPPLVMGALLAGVHNAIGLAWFAVLITGAGAASRWLRRPAVVRGIDAVTGAVLVGFGVRTALEHR